MQEAPQSAIRTLIATRITQPILLLLDNNFDSAALVLIYSGMETVAFLAMPSEKVDLMRSDFIAWVDGYVIPHLRTDITGTDLYGARCGVLRGTDARLVREGRAKRIRYSGAPVSTATVSVTVRELAAAFFAGVERCINEILQNPERAVQVERRAAEMLSTLP